MHKHFGFVFTGYDAPDMKRGFLSKLKVLNVQGCTKGRAHYILFRTAKLYSWEEVYQAIRDLDLVSVEEDEPSICSFKTAKEAQASPIGRVIYSYAYWKWKK